MVSIEGTASQSMFRTIDGVELVTPVNDGSAIAVFSIADWRADEAARELSSRTFAILGPPVDERRIRVK